MQHKQPKDEEVCKALARQQISGSKARRGDVVRFALLQGGYIFGWVVDTDACIMDMTRLVLLYVYSYLLSDSGAPAELRPRALLFPPVLTNHQGWLRGYFVSIENREPKKTDVLPQHCFADSRRPPRYFDERGALLDRRYEPCGMRAIDSFLTIDERISRALVLPSFHQI